MRDAPWVPDTLALAVGDRVRVQLSGECPGWGDWDGIGPLDHETHNEHGRVGTVGGRVDHDELEAQDGHPFWVLFDDGTESQDYYSRAELQKLDARPTPAEGQ